MTHENGTLGIDVPGLAVVELCQLEPFLLVICQTDTVPRVVVTGINPNRCPEAGQSLVKFFNHDVLVAQQGEGVREVGVHLLEKYKIQIILSFFFIFFTLGCKISAPVRLLALTVLYIYIYIIYIYKTVC